MSIRKKICILTVLLSLSALIPIYVYSRHDLQRVQPEIKLPVQEALDMENPAAAAQLVQSATVCVMAASKTDIWNGTAVIWDQTPEEIILLTSAHLLENAENSLWAFDGENKAACRIMGISQDCDLGFIAFRKDALKEETWQTADTAENIQKLCCVRLHQRTYDTLAEGDICLAVGYSPDKMENQIKELVFSQKDFTEDGIGERLFLFDGACEPGMSGSGVYDGYGHFIGMVIAADDERTAAIPMERINAAYRELVGRVRDTQDYS